MGSPEEKARRRTRMKRNKVVKDLHSPKYRQRVVEDKKNKPIDVTKLTHSQLVDLIQEKDND